MSMGSAVIWSSWKSRDSSRRHPDARHGRLSSWRRLCTARRPVTRAEIDALTSRVQFARRCLRVARCASRAPLRRSIFRSSSGVMGHSRRHVRQHQVFFTAPPMIVVSGTTVPFAPQSLQREGILTPTGLAPTRLMVHLAFRYARPPNALLIWIEPDLPLFPCLCHALRRLGARKLAILTTRIFAEPRRRHQLPAVRSIGFVKDQRAGSAERTRSSGTGTRAINTPTLVRRLLRGHVWCMVSSHYSAAQGK
jgi:hypothetical protein